MPITYLIFLSAEIFPSCDEATKDYAVVSVSSNTEFTSPIKVTPLFRSLAAGIPSPKFSESVSCLRSSTLSNKKILVLMVAEEVVLIMMLNVVSIHPAGL